MDCYDQRVGHHADGVVVRALILGSPDRVWLHGGGDGILELARAPLVEEEPAAASARTTKFSSSTTLTVTQMDQRAGAGGALVGASPGELHRLRSLAGGAAAGEELCLVASTEEAPHFGPCASEAALWEVVKGHGKQTRGLKHYSSGLCLQRQCYKGGSAPLRLGKCNQCGSARWVMLASGLLASEGVGVKFGSDVYCVYQNGTLTAANAAVAAAKAKAKAKPPPPPPKDANATDAEAAVAEAIEDDAAAAAEEEEDDDEVIEGSNIAYTSACGPHAEPIVIEAARMTLAIPTSSADTLLDDWLADVARAQKEEVGLLREALIASRESDAAVRKAMSNEGKAYTEKISTLEGEKQDLIFKVEKEENKVSELTKEGVDKERRLKHAQEARKEASEKEAKWRSELTEAVETGGKYKEEADAARGRDDLGLGTGG